MGKSNVAFRLSPWDSTFSLGWEVLGLLKDWGWKKAKEQHTLCVDEESPCSQSKTGLCPSPPVHKLTLILSGVVLELGSLGRSLGFNEVMRVEPWSDRTEVFVRRGRDARELSLYPVQTQREGNRLQSRKSVLSRHRLSWRLDLTTGRVHASSLCVCYDIYFCTRSTLQKQDQQGKQSGSPKGWPRPRSTDLPREVQSPNLVWVCCSWKHTPTSITGGGATVFYFYFPSDGEEGSRNKEGRQGVCSDLTKLFIKK